MSDGSHCHYCRKAECICPAQAPNELDVIEKALKAALGTHGDPCVDPRNCPATRSFGEALVALATLRQREAALAASVTHLEGKLEVARGAERENARLREALKAIRDLPGAEGQDIAAQYSDVLRRIERIILAALAPAPRNADLPEDACGGDGTYLYDDESERSDEPLCDGDTQRSGATNVGGPQGGGSEDGTGAGATPSSTPDTQGRDGLVVTAPAPTLPAVEPWGGGFLPAERQAAELPQDVAERMFAEKDAAKAKEKSDAE